MANLSDQTRKEQVLTYLTEHAGQWVDGPELANEQVGGSEGLRRVRELVQDNHPIKTRQHPDPRRDIWQYMLVPSLGTMPANEQVRELKNPVQPVLPTGPPPAEKPVYQQPEPRTQTRIGDAVKRKEDGTFEYVPPQRSLTEVADETPQPEGSKFESMPKNVVYGEVAICDRCHSKTTRGRPPKKESEEEADKRRRRRRKTNEDAPPSLVDPEGVLLFRDPHKKGWPCIRCNGYGIVPNLGPVLFTPPTGAPRSEPLKPEEEAPSEALFDFR